MKHIKNNNHISLLFIIIAYIIIGIIIDLFKINLTDDNTHRQNINLINNITFCFIKSLLVLYKKQKKKRKSLN